MSILINVAVLWTSLAFAVWVAWATRTRMCEYRALKLGQVRTCALPAGHNCHHMTYIDGYGIDLEKVLP